MTTSVTADHGMTFDDLFHALHRIRQSTIRNEVTGGGEDQMTVSESPNDRQTSIALSENTCEYCGEPFSRPEELRMHHWENLWEAHHVMVRDEHRCTVCGESFDTMDDWTFHWKIGKCNAFAAADFLKGTFASKREEEWLMQPTERALMNKRLRTDPRYRNVRWGIGVAGTVEEQFDYAPEYKAMLVTETYGPSESGKSTIVLSMVYESILPRARKALARDWMDRSEENYLAVQVELAELQAKGNRVTEVGTAISIMKRLKVWREPRVFFTFSVAQTLRIIKTVARKHDNIIQDEDKGLLGRGRDSTIKKLQTILEISRARQVNFHFISPRNITYLVNVNLTVKVYGKALPLEKRITRSILLDEDEDAIGVFQHPIITTDAHIQSTLEFEQDQIHKISEIREEVLRDPERGLTSEQVDAILAGEDARLSIMIIYELYKYENLERTIEKEGADSWEFSIDELEESAKRAAAIIIKRYGEAQARGFTKEEVKMLMSSKDVGVKDFGESQNFVGGRAHHYINEDSKGDVGSGDDPKDTPEDEVQEVAFSINPLDYLDQVEREWALDPKHAQNVRWVGIYRRFIREWQESSVRPKSREILQWMEDAGVRKKDGTVYTSKGNISERFGKVEGTISKLQGDAFEAEMFDLYSASGLVQIMDPPDNRPQPKGCPDRIVFLRIGTVRVCSWKCYPSNATIPIQGPEMIEARKMITDGNDRVKLILEGLCPHGFFSVEIDPDSKKKTRTIFKRECGPFPPDMDKLLNGDR